MKYCQILSLVAAVPVAYGVAFGGPAPTDISPDRALEGTSPIPTRGPSVEELRKRQSFSEATCGWVSGDLSSALTCSAGRTCMLYKSAGSGMAGCCLGSDTRNCGWVSSCVDYQSYTAGSCGSSCLLNDFIRKCTNAAAPFCATYTYPSGGVADYGCDSDSNQLYTVRQTGTDSFGSAESVRLSTVTSARFTTATYTSYSGYTPSRKTATKLAIGTIIGIVIAVLAIIFFIGIGICMCLKRKKKQKQIAANAGIIANVQANRPQSQFQPVPQPQMQQAPPPPAQSPPPPMNGYFPPPQEHKYNGHTSVYEHSNASTPAPAYAQPYMASGAPPMPQQQSGQYQPPMNGAHEVPSPISQQHTGQYQPPLNGAHEVPSPLSQQHTGQYQAPMNGAHEVPSPDMTPLVQPQPQAAAPMQQYQGPPAGAHEVDANSAPHAPGKTGPVYEMGGR